jgi:hypothetical protein
VSTGAADWVVAAICPPDVLANLATEVLGPTDEEGEHAHWQVGPGTGDHSSVRGSDPSGEDPLLLARVVSARVPREVYAIVKAERLYGVYVWSDGEGGGETGRSPDDCCLALGITAL